LNYGEITCSRTGGRDAVVSELVECLCRGGGGTRGADGRPQVIVPAGSTTSGTLSGCGFGRDGFPGLRSLPWALFPGPVRTRLY
jgi:hypothetical protein